MIHLWTQRSILALCGSLLFLSGCNRLYFTEKLFWEAKQIMKEIEQRPKSTPAGLYLKAEDAFKLVINHYPKSDVAAAATMSIGDLYTMQKKWVEAESTYQSILKNFPKSKELTVQVKIAIGRLKEKEGKYPEAEIIYKDILNQFDDTTSSLPLPILTARKYLKSDHPDKIMRYYEEAVQYYENIQVKYPKTALASGAMDLQYQCYTDRGMWTEAIVLLDKIQEKFPNTLESKRAQASKDRIIKGLKSIEERRSKLEVPSEGR